MNTHADDRQIVVDIPIAAPIGRVWAALREPALVETWFGWEAPSLRDEIQFIFFDSAHAVPERHLIEFGEWEGVRDAIELTEEGRGTRLRVVRSGGMPIDWDGVYEDISQGWITFFQQLRLALELHPGTKRRTIYLSGAARPGVGDPNTALGLGIPSDYRPGEAFAMALAPGDQISGRVWYTTHFQTALMVEEWGRGLLVVSDMGKSPKRPHGGGSVLITTYGLGAAAFDALEGRWRSWWGARFDTSGA